jgi:hypothetical protein
MSAYSEKVAKAKHGFYRVADFETVREITHTIAYLLEDQVVFDGEKKDILCFEDTGRQLILNVTNAETLITLFGDEPNAWAGRRVTLFRGTYGKDNKPCVRVKAATGAPVQTTAGASRANGAAAKETTQSVVQPTGSLDLDESIPF